jgi:DNA processing protein
MLADRSVLARRPGRLDGVTSGRTEAFGDQLRARERAANYFTLFEILRNQQATDDAWRFVQGQVDVGEPFQAGVGAILGRLDIDDEAVLSTRHRVRIAMEGLMANDLVLERGASGYPDAVDSTTDAPEFLFVRQDANVLELPSISIVGTRSATEEGRARARKLAQLLVKRGIAVCSGLAAGIDAAAHEGALDVGGVTIAVIGTPLTKVYPKQNAALQERIGTVGALVSQFHPGAKTLPLCFPLRNATMSALSLGTVVIEASETSGALIQARKALQQDRKLFIPRSAVENPRLAWPRKFEALGAHVFAHIDDLIGVLEREGLIPKRELPTPRLSATVSVGAA